MDYRSQRFNDHSLANVSFTIAVYEVES